MDYLLILSAHHIDSNGDVIIPDKTDFQMYCWPTV